MGIDRFFLGRLLQELETHHQLLVSASGSSQADLFADPLRALGTQHALQICIEVMLNITHHVLARLTAKAPERNVDAVSQLATLGVIRDPVLRENLPKMVRFRNLIVHRYWEVNPDVVYTVLQNHLGDFGQFAREIVTFLDENPHL